MINFKNSISDECKCSHTFQIILQDIMNPQYPFPSFHIYGCVQQQLNMPTVKNSIDEHFKAQFIVTSQYITQKALLSKILRHCTKQLIFFGM